MSLERYWQKRDFTKTPEPAGQAAEATGGNLRFVVQKHAARRLHYDFRLELDGTLKSWAIPKGPSLDPADKRLAVQVEDHPLDYADFEGTIPAHEYGGGHVVVWDRGTWTPMGDAREGYRAGNLKFQLEGEKLHGKFALVRMKSRESEGKENWLLIKERDDEARPGQGAVLTESRPESVLSGRTLDDLAGVDKKSPRRRPRSAGATAVNEAPERTHRNGDIPAARRIGSPRVDDDPTLVEGVRITHPERVLYPESGITKLEVAQYYARMAPHIVPFIRHRPISLVRCPQGTAGSCFFQKHATGREIPGISFAMITESSGEKPYVLANNARALTGLAQMGTLELHAWNATADDVEKCDTLVFDFDPDPSVAFATVVDAVLQCREVLASLGLASFAKTTGGKGLHLVVPLTRRVPWSVAKEFTRGVAERLLAREPDLYVLKASKSARRNRIFIDYLRNARGATAVVPYSIRAREGAPVAVPLYWNEVSSALDASAFTLRSVEARVTRGGDPWAGYRTTRQTLTVEMQRRLARAA
ncbi:MAG: non-homologous end-joining DNA ligase [Pseudomonadota bacterium]|nr:non-homologous end-joining DNA ligase [Pseudomonadota bacterium]